MHAIVVFVIIMLMLFCRLRNDSIESLTVGQMVGQISRQMPSQKPDIPKPPVIQPVIPTSIPQPVIQPPVAPTSIPQPVAPKPIQPVAPKQPVAPIQQPVIPKPPVIPQPAIQSSGDTRSYSGFSYL